VEKSQQLGHLFLVVIVLTWGANFGIVKSAFEATRSIGVGPISSFDSAPLILFIDGNWL
jgi:hypothetical protein